MRVFRLTAALAAVLVMPLSAQRETQQPKVISAVTAAVDVPNYQGGPCPAKLTFTGTIVADKEPTVPIKYQWVRSDTSAHSPVRTITMTGKGAVVTDTWSVGSSGDMMRVWSELRILSPNSMKSNRVMAAVLCR